MAMIVSQNAVSSCNGPCPCPFCKCPKNKLSEIGTAFPTRKRAETALLAHACVGTCPACEMEIVRVVTNKKTQVPLLTSAGVHPDVPVKKKGKGVTPLSLHYGIVARQVCNYHLEPDDWGICILHANLCIEGTILQKGLLNHIGKLNDPLVTKSQGEALYDCMALNGLTMKKTKLAKKSKKLDQYDLSFKSSSFTGRGGEIIHRIRDKLIIIVMPDTVCGPWMADDVLFGPDAAAVELAVKASIAAAPNTEAARQRFALRRVWHAWGECWALLNKDMDDDDQTTYKQVWAVRAEEVRLAMEDFVRKHKVCMGVTEGLYLHILHAHAHEQIIKWGSLKVRQSQGLEHCHKIRKRIGCEATNRKPGQRLGTMMAHVHIKAWVDRLASQSFHASVHEQKKRSKLKRMMAKLARVEASMPTITRAHYSPA